MKNFKWFIKRFSIKNLKKDFKDIIKGITWTDIVFLTILPIVMLLIMLLPQPIRDSLSLNIKDYSWWQLFTSNFVHQNWDHFLGNMKTYFLFVIPIFILANYMKEKKTFFKVFTLIVLSFPIISSILVMLIYPVMLPTLTSSKGFSGIVAALLGLFPVFLIIFFSKKSRKELKKNGFINLSVTFIALLFMITYYPLHKNILQILPFLAALLIEMYFYRKNIIKILKMTLNTIKYNTILYLLLITIMVFFVIMPETFFPIKIIQEGGIVDFFIHYVGIIYGLLFGSWIAFKK